MKYPCIESTLDIECGNAAAFIRLWINKTEIPTDFTEETNILNNIDNWIKEKNRDLKEILEYCAAIPNVNAVQVKWRTPGIETGVVVYTVNFAGDVHG